MNCENCDLPLTKEMGGGVDGTGACNFTYHTCENPDCPGDAGTWCKPCDVRLEYVDGEVQPCECGKAVAA